jgi:hypothetical protein
MNNTNELLSSDNKGYAALITELGMNGMNVMPGNGSFVAAFPATNLGDVSPNVCATGIVCAYRWVPKFWTYGSVCCACAEVTKNTPYFFNGSKT